MCGLETPAVLSGISGEPWVVSTQVQLWAESSWVPAAGVRGTLARVAAAGGLGVPQAEELHGHVVGQHELGTGFTDGLVFLRGHPFTRESRGFGKVEIKRKRV